MIMIQQSFIAKNFPIQHTSKNNQPLPSTDCSKQASTLSWLGRQKKRNRQGVIVAEVFLLSLCWKNERAGYQSALSAFPGQASSAEPLCKIWPGRPRLCSMVAKFNFGGQFFGKRAYASGNSRHPWYACGVRVDSDGSGNAAAARCIRRRRMHPSPFLSVFLYIYILQDTFFFKCRGQR